MSIIKHIKHIKHYNNISSFTNIIHNKYTNDCCILLNFIYLIIITNEYNNII